MRNHELISAIAEESVELRDLSTSGGVNEQAFDLWAHQDRLQSIHDELVQLGTAIRIEAKNLSSS